MSDLLYDRAFELGHRHQTPLFVFFPARLSEALTRFRLFTGKLPFGTEIYYSYKTNYLPTLCQWLADAGVGAEVTSPVEWELATGLNAIDRIVVNGIGKCADGLLQRIVHDTEHSPRLVNLETDTEIEAVCRRGLSGNPLRVGLRVTLPGFPGEHGRDPSERWGQGAEKFGWQSHGEAILHAARRLSLASPAVDLLGLHLHFGAQMVSPARYDVALHHVCRLLERLRREGITISVLDFGGGIASGHVAKRRSGPLYNLLRTIGIRLPLAVQQAPDLDGIAAVFHRHAPALRRLGITKLVFEPGRYLAEPTMMAVTQVVAVRHDGDRTHAVLDAGTNVLKCWRSNENRPLTFDGLADGPAERVELVGPLCHRSDTFGTHLLPGPVRVGALVCIDAVGAYSLGDWIANAWRRPAVYGEDGTLLWVAQDSTDLLRPGMPRIDASHAR